MADETQEQNQGEQLIKQELITREDLDRARVGGAQRRAVVQAAHRAAQDHF